MVCPTTLNMWNIWHYINIQTLSVPKWNITSSEPCAVNWNFSYLYHLVVQGSKPRSGIILFTHLIKPRKQEQFGNRGDCLQCHWRKWFSLFQGSVAPCIQTAWLAGLLIPRNHSTTPRGLKIRSSVCLSVWSPPAVCSGPVLHTGREGGQEPNKETERGRRQKIKTGV